MAGRQPFDELLDAAGPSDFRGRGRGRGGRGRGGFQDGPRGRGVGRGGSGRGAYPGRGNSLGASELASRRGGGGSKADYSNVAFDYTKIEKQGHVNLASRSELLSPSYLVRLSQKNEADD